MRTKTKWPPLRHATGFTKMDEPMEMKEEAWRTNKIRSPTRHWFHKMVDKHIANKEKAGRANSTWLPALENLPYPSTNRHMQPCRERIAHIYPQNNGLWNYAAAIT